MKKIHLILLSILAVIVICFSNCKKSSTNNVTPKVDTPFVYGELYAFRQKEQDTFGSAYLVTVEYAYGLFWADSITAAAANPGIVSVDRDTLPNPGSDNYYAYDFADSVNWNVQGGTSVPAFSYSLPGSYPDYLGSIPDTMHAIAGLAFDIPAANTNNADSIGIEFAPYHSVHGIPFVYIANIGAITIALNNLSVSNYGLGSIIVTSWKTNYIVLNGKKYKFIRLNRIVKQLYIE